MQPHSCTRVGARFWENALDASSASASKEKRKPRISRFLWQDRALAKCASTMTENRRERTVSTGLWSGPRRLFAGILTWFGVKNAP